MSRHNPYQAPFPFARYPAVRVVLLLAGGIILSRHLPGSAAAWGAALGGAALCWAVAALQGRGRNAPGYTHLATLGYSLFLLAFGGWWSALHRQHPPPAGARLLEAYTWQRIEVQGTVRRAAPTASGDLLLDVAADTIVLEDSLRWTEPTLVRARWDTAEITMRTAPAAGSGIRFAGTLYPLEAPRNPGTFNYKNFLAGRGIYAHMGISRIDTVRPAPLTWSWATLRRLTMRQIEHNFDAETAPLAKALLTGYKQELDPVARTAFSRAGLSHIMAVSGLHVGFIIAPFWLIIPFFWTFRCGKKLGLGILVVLLVTYAGLTGFSASVSRASLTGGLLAYGRLFHQFRDSRNLTAVAALIILLADPRQLFTIGFQLSFAAVYIILLVLPVIQKGIPRRIRHRWYAAPLMIMIVSLVVQAGLYPILAYYFGEFSLVGPLVNAVVVPWLGLVLPLALLLLPLSALFPDAVFLLNAPCRWFLGALQAVVDTAAGWSGAWIAPPAPGPFLFAGWVAGLLLVASLPFPHRRWKMLILLLAVLCMGQARQLYRKAAPPALQLTLLDVGQGDAIHIRTPGGRHILIDTGRWSPGYDSGRFVILPYLQAAGVRRLNAVFLSHPHADHIGGLPSLLRGIPVDTIYNAGADYDSELYHRYRRLARDRGIPVRSLRAGQRVALDPAVRIHIYGPAPVNRHTDPNERSLVMEMTYGRTDILFTGDAGAAQEKLLLRHYGPLLNTRFLKAGHHGSRTSSSGPFLAAASPRITAVSLGFDNRYGHPHPEAVHRLRETAGNLYFTSLQGALRFESDGATITRRPWR